MRIEGNSSAYGAFKASAGAKGQDGQLKAIQDQIKNVQKQLQDLASNEDMPAKLKMEQQKELQQQIQDLNTQMSQRQMEIQKEKTQATTSEHVQETGGTETQRAEKAQSAAMKTLINADASLKNAQTLQSVKNRMEGRAAVIEAEIKLDGGASDSKMAELSAMKGKANIAGKDVMETLTETDANIKEVSGNTEASNVNPEGNSDTAEDKKIKEDEPQKNIDVKA